MKKIDGSIPITGGATLPENGAAVVLVEDRNGGVKYHKSRRNLPSELLDETQPGFSLLNTEAASDASVGNPVVPGMALVTDALPCPTLESHGSSLPASTSPLPASTSSRFAAFDDEPTAALRFPEGALPDLGLVTRLVESDPEDMVEHDLGDGIAAWERVVAWARSKQFAWINELHIRCVREFAEMTRGMLVDKPSGTVAVAIGKNRDASAAELSALLTISHHDAKARIETATALHTHLFETGEALEKGVITSGKAELLALRLARLSPQVAIAVEATTLQTAHEKPRYQFAKSIEAAIIAVDPGGASARLLAARTNRRVERPTALADGMATWRAILPAEQALQAHRTLTTIARKAKTATEPRNLDQLRADILSEILTFQRMPLRIDGEYPASSEVHQSNGGQQEDVSSGDRTSIAQSPETVDRNPAASCTRTSDADSDHGASASASASAGFGANANTCAGARVGSAEVQEPHRCGYEVLVTIPAPVLAGSGPAPAIETGSDPPGSGGPWVDRVATLAGYGPIGAVLAQMIAGDPRSRWRIAVTDGNTGRILDLAKRTYRPPADMARLVRARDPKCVFPSCNRPSHECDLDHTRPFVHKDPVSGGQTCPANLAPLCRTHHNLKTLGLWGLKQSIEGIFTWTSPLGLLYSTDKTSREAPTLTVDQIFAEPKHDQTPDLLSTESPPGGEGQANVEGQAGVEGQANVEGQAGVEGQANVEGQAGVDGQYDSGPPPY